GYCGIDLDDCRDPETGQLSPDATAIVERFASYTEVSPSGTGVKIICKGDPRPVLGQANSKSGNYEIFSHHKYFTLTGVVVGEHRSIQEAPKAISWFITTKLKKKATGKHSAGSACAKPKTKQTRCEPSKDDETHAHSWEAMKRSKKWPAIERLL